MLEQLRTVSIPREADPPDDFQRHGGQGAPIYGDGLNIRDWIYVETTAGADAVLHRGRKGESTTSGPQREDKPLGGARDSRPPGGNSFAAPIVADGRARPPVCHGFLEIERELGWRPLVTFEKGFVGRWSVPGCAVVEKDQDWGVPDYYKRMYDGR